MAKPVALEIVQQRNDGGWYTTRRCFDAIEWPSMHQWTAGRAGYTERWIYDPVEPMLSMSASPLTQMEYRAKRSTSVPYQPIPYMTPKAEAEQDGFDFGQAFSSAVVTQAAPEASLYQLGYHFAKQYSTDVDIVGAYVSGFIRGWIKPAVKQLTTSVEPSSQQ